jgi:hypothetical protein
MQDIAILVVICNKGKVPKDTIHAFMPIPRLDPCTNMLEVVLKPTFPDDMSRDEMLTQFMYLINQYSTDL